MQPQTKREQAEALLKELFLHANRVTIEDAMAVAKERGLSRRTMQRATAAVGIQTVTNGPYGGIWEIRAEV